MTTNENPPCIPPLVRGEAINENNEPHIFSIIPAAGMSRRMGQPKQTLPYQNTTLLGSVVRTILSTKMCAVVVVTHSDLKDKLQIPEDNRLHTAINDDENSQMLDSIIIGLKRLQQIIEPKDSDGILVVPADMPTLTIQTLNQCMDTFISQQTRIVIASYNGKRGHPIIFPYTFKRELDNLDDGLRSLINKFPDNVTLVETTDPGVTHDVDTPEQYEQL